MDAGVQFVLKNFEDTLNLCASNPAYKSLYNKVYSEYLRVKTIKFTGNMIEHFDKFKGSKHKYASTFAFLKSYGLLTNEELSDYLRLHYPAEVSHYMSISDLVEGNVYSNNEIVTLFGVAYMGGMRKSNKKNCLVLIAKHNNPLYDDQWTDTGILNYTGMGKTGNQDIANAQNWTLNKLPTNGVKAYLFEAYQDNEYYYDGEVILAGKPFQAKELDDTRRLRDVWKFPLKRVSGLGGVAISKADVDAAEEEKKRAVSKESPASIKKKAQAAGTTVRKVTTVTSTQIGRNQYVDEFTKIRAGGVCDLCDQAAPFTVKGKPYLECHHVNFLADGGPDAIYNTVALCPNCHRKMHFVKDKNDKKKLVKKIEKYLTDDGDTASLAEFKKIKF